MVVARMLEEVAAFGPYFVISTGPAEASDATWRSMPERDPDRLRELISAYGTRLGTAEERVAASILFQGLASRLWSPVMACAVQGLVPDLTGLRWRWAPGAPIALWLPEPLGWETANPVERVHQVVVEDQLRPLRAAMLEVVGLADGLLWGNAASALAGTLRLGSLRPELIGPLRDLIQDLLGRSPLIGTGSLLDGDPAFVRRSCCLYYRVPPGGELCGDCALAVPPGSKPSPPPGLTPPPVTGDARPDK